MAEDARLVDWMDPAELLMIQEESEFGFPLSEALSDTKILKLMDFAANNKPRYEVIKMKALNPHLTDIEIAKASGVHRNTVRKYLKPRGVKKT